MSDISSTVTEHAEEAAFLWLLRDLAAAAPHYSLGDLAELDERVEAHIDGLRIAGESGWHACQDALSWKETGEVFVAAVLALESGGGDRFQEVVDVVMNVPISLRGLVSALGWLPYERVGRHIAQLQADSMPKLREVGIAAGTSHRLVGRHALHKALADSYAPLRARACRAVGQLGAIGMLENLRPLVGDSDEHCRFWASWTSYRLGDEKAVWPLREVAESGGEHAENAAALALKRMPPAVATTWLKDLAAKSATRRLGVIGAGASGDPALIPWLIEQAETPELARVAGEAFRMITGADLEAQRLTGTRPCGFRCGPSDDPTDEDVRMDPDECVPWPDPVLLDRWWQRHRGEFNPGQRHLIGKPITAEWARYLLQHARQRERAAAAIELGLIHPDQPLFEVRAPGWRQWRLLDRVGGAHRALSFETEGQSGEYRGES